MSALLTFTVSCWSVTTQSSTGILFDSWNFFVKFQVFYQVLYYVLAVIHFHLFMLKDKQANPHYFLENCEWTKVMSKNAFDREENSGKRSLVKVDPIQFRC